MRLLAQLPGLGPRSGKRAALHLMKKKDERLIPLLEALEQVRETVQPCTLCGNLDTSPQCSICTNPKRDSKVICVVEEVEDLWAMERSGSFQGTYHVLGGVLSALDGMGPDQLNVAPLLKRLEGVEEVIIALSATLEGQTTAHFLGEKLAPFPVRVTGLARGLPVGGNLDYLDEGTILAALEARHPIE